MEHTGAHCERSKQLGSPLTRRHPNLCSCPVLVGNPTSTPTSTPTLASTTTSTPTSASTITLSTFFLFRSHFFYPTPASTSARTTAVATLSAFCPFALSPFFALAARDVIRVVAFCVALFDSRGQVGRVYIAYGAIQSVTEFSQLSEIRRYHHNLRLRGQGRARE